MPQLTLATIQQLNSPNKKEQEAAHDLIKQILSWRSAQNIPEDLYQDMITAMKAELDSIPKDILNQWANPEDDDSTVYLRLDGKSIRINKRFLLFITNHIDMAVAKNSLYEKFGKDSLTTKTILETTSGELFLRPILIDYLIKHCDSNIAPEDLGKILTSEAFLSIHELITTFNDADACYQQLYLSQYISDCQDSDANEKLKAMILLNMTVNQSSSILNVTSNLIAFMNQAHQAATRVQSVVYNLKAVGGIGSMISQSISVLLQPILWYIKWKRTGEGPTLWNGLTWLTSAAGLTIAAVIFAGIATPLITAVLFTTLASISFIRNIGSFIETAFRLRKLKKEQDQLTTDINNLSKQLKQIRETYSQKLKALQLLLIEPYGCKDFDKIQMLNKEVEDLSHQINTLNTQFREKTLKKYTKECQYNELKKERKSIAGITTKSLYTAAGLATVIGTAFLFFPPLLPAGIMMISAGLYAGSGTFLLSMIGSGIKYLFNKFRRKNTDTEQNSLTTNKPDSEEQLAIKKEYKQIFSFKYKKEKKGSLDKMYEHASTVITEDRVLSPLDSLIASIHSVVSPSDIAVVIYHNRDFICKHFDSFLKALSDKNNPDLFNHVRKLSELTIDDVASMDRRIAKTLFSPQQENWVKRLSSRVKIPTFEEADLKQKRSDNTLEMVEAMINPSP